MTILRSARELEQEHEVIQKIFAAMSVITNRIEQTRPADWTLVSNVGEFLREYADRFHHAKEEQSLFPVLENSGVPASGCPLAALRHEHEVGRGLVSELKNINMPAGDDAFRREQTISVLRKLVRLYVERMWKEDYLLIPMSDKLLSQGDDDTLVREFENVNATFGSATRQKFEKFAASLESHVVETGATT